METVTCRYLARFGAFWRFCHWLFVCAGGCEDLLALLGPWRLAGTVAAPLAIAPPIGFTFSLPFLYQINFLKGKGPARRGTPHPSFRHLLPRAEKDHAAAPPYHPYPCQSGICSWYSSAGILFPTNG